MQDNRPQHLAMSEIFANFALSQESDNISNFSGSVSQKLEIENVGNFLLTQAEHNGSHAVYAWAVFLHLFVNWFPTTIYQKLQRFQATLLLYQ